MGFGTLFIGYFLILNLTYYGFTDVIAASVMLLGLYKLSTINKHFRYSAITTVAFLACSVIEFGIAAYEMFFKEIESTALISSIDAIRYLLIGILTVFMLIGICELAKEVGIDSIAKKSKRFIYLSAIIFGLWIILELPFTFIDPYTLILAYLFNIIATLAVVVINLTIIYSCYMKICMPGDEDVIKDKPSRFEFVNQYRARKAERAAEENAKRIAELKKKQEKKAEK